MFVFSHTVANTYSKITHIFHIAIGQGNRKCRETERKKVSNRDGVDHTTRIQTSENCVFVSLDSMFLSSFHAFSFKNISSSYYLHAHRPEYSLNPLTKLQSSHSKQSNNSKTKNKRK